MKYSKGSALLLAATIVLQLLIPFSFAASKEKILKKGTECKIRIQSVEFDDDSVKLDFPSLNSGEKDDARYAVLKEQRNGIYELMEFTSEKPSGELYLKSSSVRKYVSPIGEYPFDDVCHSGFCDTYWENINSGRYFYCTVKILDGTALLTGIYLNNGTPAEDL